MKKILIVGAGRLGKGFIGETFDRAGWRIAFMDKDARVIGNLNANRSYRVTVHREDRIEERTVSGYAAYTPKDALRLANDVMEADVVALAIYPEDFKDAIAWLSPGLRERAKHHPDKNLDILCLTNKNALMKAFEHEFFAHLETPDRIDWFKRRVSLRDTIIRRATDAADNASLHVRTTAVLSLLIQGPLSVPLHGVEWMEECDRVELLKDLKVFMVNGPHVTAAFAGYLKGYATLNQTMRDPECASLTQRVRDEIQNGILRAYPITKKELDKLSVFPQAQGEMEDYVTRVAYDPIRKLARHDRLTGIACVCMENGVAPDAIAASIANGFAYDHADDPQAVRLQLYIRENGIVKAIVRHCGIAPDSPLVGKIKRCYDNIAR